MPQNVMGNVILFRLFSPWIHLNSKCMPGVEPFAIDVAVDSHICVPKKTISRI